MTPTAPLSEALADFIANRVDRKRKLTQEVVDSVLDTGQVVIRGNILPVTGRVPIIRGETVAVAWRDGKMDVVMMNQGRRSGTGAQDVQQVAGIVEELFVFEVDQTLQVWFRNADQFKPIRFVDEQAADANAPTTLGFAGGGPFWGLGDSDFFVFSGTLTPSGDRAMAVYRLNRPKKNEPFPNGTKVTAQLVRFYNLTTDAFSFGTISISATDTLLTQLGTVSGALKYTAQYSLPGAAGPTDPPFGISVESLAEPGGVAPNGDLVVVIRVRGSAAVADPGRTGITFDMGSLIVNVTRSLVLANHLLGSIARTVNVSPSSSAVCTPIGTATVSVSNSTAEKTGAVTVLSLTGTNPQRPADPNEPGTFNNYVLISPATAYVSAVQVTTPPGEIFCAPARDTLRLNVIGEFAARNEEFATFPGNIAGPRFAQVARFQGSRTLLAYAPYIEAGGAAGPPSIRDLRQGVSTALEGNADLLFGSSPTGPSAGKPLLFMLQASLIYSPFDNRAPFNHQFFVSGHNKSTGVVQINLAALRKLTALATQAKLAPAKSSTQVLMVTIGFQSRQALDSPLNLGSGFQAGPL